MTEARKRLLSTIKKLILLGTKNTNEHEAASALAKAQQLMREHGLTETDVEVSTIAETKSAASTAQRPAQWESDLVTIVEEAFGLQALLCPEWQGSPFAGRWVGRWRFVGPDVRVEIGQYAFDVLMRQAKRARAEYLHKHLRRVRRAGIRMRRADLFCEGWVWGAKRLLSRFVIPQAEQRAMGSFIALHHELGDGLVPRDRTSGTLKDHELADHHRGHKAGADARLYNGVGAREALALSA